MAVAEIGITDHGELTGLGDDDHTQYVLRSILTTDGDMFTRSAGSIVRLGIGAAGQILSVLGGLPTWSSHSVIDHGNLSGLADDDHTQYLLADGTRQLTGNWTVGPFDISTTGRIVIATDSTTALRITEENPINGGSIEVDTVGFSMKFNEWEVHMNTDSKLQFRDTGLFIHSPSDGKILYSSDGAGNDDHGFTGRVTFNDRAFFADRVVVQNDDQIMFQGAFGNGTIEWKSDEFVPSVMTIDIGASSSLRIDGIIEKRAGEGHIVLEDAVELRIGSGNASQRDFKMFYNSTSGILQIERNTGFAINANIVSINENSNDLDFRANGTTLKDLIRTDAANDRVGFFTGTPLEKFHVNDDALFSGEVKGCRMMIGGGNNNAMSGDGYLKGFNGQFYTATLGVSMARPGSVVDIAVTFNVTSILVAGTIDFEVHKNGTAVFAAQTNVTTSGDKEIHANQARDVDTFVAGDILSLFVNFTGFVGSINDIQAWAGIQLDE